MKIAIIIAAIIIVILIVLFVVISVNSDNDTNTNQNTNKVEVTSFSETENSIMINFYTCELAKHRIDVALGSTTFDIREITDDSCVMYYGAEVENPLWDGTLDMICYVPLGLGEVTFPKTDLGVNFNSIQQYCDQV